MALDYALLQSETAKQREQIGSMGRQILSLQERLKLKQAEAEEVEIRFRDIEVAVEELEKSKENEIAEQRKWYEEKLMTMGSEIRKAAFESEAQHIKIKALTDEKA